MVRLTTSFYIKSAIKSLNKLDISGVLSCKFVICRLETSVGKNTGAITSLLHFGRSDPVLNFTPSFCKNRCCDHKAVHTMSNEKQIGEPAPSVEEASCPDNTTMDGDLPMASKEQLDDASQTPSMSKRALKREHKAAQSSQISKGRPQNQCRQNKDYETEIEIKAISNGEDGENLKQCRAQKYKELKKKRKAHAAALDGKDGAGYSQDEFNETSYYFENGLRKVYPYHYTFATHAKGRWVGRTLKDVLTNEFGFNHPSEVDKAFEREKIRVNSKLVSSNYVVRNCDYISHEIHRHENPVTDAPIEVIENNEDVIVINKPASIPCHPCGRYRYNSLVFILGREMGCSNLRNIYRLDRMTSGVLILGKTTQSTKLLEDQVVSRQVQKEYVCRVVGEFPSEPVTVDQPLQALSNKLRLQVVSPNGKTSQTTFHRLSYNGRSSVVRCTPHTGRTHQIRVHLQFLGHPIINDVFYNSDAWGPTRGKGGVYEVSHDETCTRIYHTHQATQWDGGDNPLYFDKVRKESDETRTQPIPESSSAVAESLASSSSASHNTVLKTDNASNGNPSSLSSSCPSPSPHPTAEKEEKNFNCSPTRGGTLDRLSDQPAPSAVSGFDRSKEAGDANSSLRPQFDASKWNVDTSCEMCRRKCVDPQQRDLVMFLHAVKYKGPGWEYESSWPEWAREDWSKEDEYTVESFSQSHSSETLE